MCFFDTVDARVRRDAHAVAADVAAFLTGDAVPVAEIDRMAPLTDWSAGRFRSPLSGVGPQPSAQPD